MLSYLRQEHYTQEEQISFIRAHGPFDIFGSFTFDKGVPSFSIAADLCLKYLDAWAHKRGEHMRHFIWSAPQPERQKGYDKKVYHFHTLTCLSNVSETLQRFDFQKIQEEALHLWAVKGVQLSEDNGYTWYSTRHKRRAKESVAYFQNKLSKAVVLKPITSGIDSLLHLVEYLDDKHSRFCPSAAVPYYFGCPHTDNRCKRGGGYDGWKQRSAMTCAYNRDKKSTTKLYRKWIKENRSKKPVSILTLPEQHLVLPSHIKSENRAGGTNIHLG